MRILVLLLLLPLTMFAQQPSSASFRSLNELPEFKELKDGGGQALSGMSAAQKPLCVSIWLGNGKTVFTLLQVVATDNEGKVRYRLLDTLVTPAPNLYLRVEIRDCEDAQGKRLLFLTETEFDDDGKRFPSPKRAWYANAETLRFEKVADIRTLRCDMENEGDGGCTGE